MGGRLGGGLQGGGGETGVAGGGREAGTGTGRGGSGKMAELPSGRLSHSPGRRDPPGSPRPACSRAAPLGRRPRGWCEAERGGGGGCKDSTPAPTLGVGRGERGEDQAGSRHSASPGKGGQRAPGKSGAGDSCRLKRRGRRRGQHVKIPLGVHRFTFEKRLETAIELSPAPHSPSG